MASPCVVQFCKNIGNRRFPQDETRRSRWLEAIKHIKTGLTIRKKSFICSTHFTPADFISPSSHLAGAPRERSSSLEVFYKMSEKIKFRDVYYGIQKIREFLLGRKYTLHNRFLPFMSPRSVTQPDISKRSVIKYSDNYYVHRHAFDSVKPPVIAPVAEALPTDRKCGETAVPICFQSAPTPGRVWWWDGHCYYDEEKKAIQGNDDPKLQGPK